MPQSFVVVLTTLPNRSKSRQLAKLILKKKLAACVNTVGPADSFFWWEKKIDHTKEYLLLIKTQSSYFRPLCRLIEKHHPYSVPEIIALPIQSGNVSYLDWIRKSLH